MRQAVLVVMIEDNILTPKCMQVVTPHYNYTVLGHYDAHSIRKEENTLEFQYDSKHRMKYHPEFHFSHGQPYTESDLEYLCRFCHCDSMRHLSFALGKTERNIADKIMELKRNGLFNYYQTLNKHYV